MPGEDTDLLAQVRLPDGVRSSASTRVGRQPHDAGFDPASGRVVVADELGGSVSFVQGDGRSRPGPGPVQPGGLAVADGRAGVVDVRGNLLYVYDVAAAREIARLPVGAGATHAVAIADSAASSWPTPAAVSCTSYALDGTPRVLSRVPFARGLALRHGGRPGAQAALGRRFGQQRVLRYEIGPDGTLTRER